MLNELEVRKIYSHGVERFKNTQGCFERYSLEFKKRIVSQVKYKGVMAVAKSSGMPHATIRQWVKANG